MVCTECRVFSGTPVCGACRAVNRIVGLLRSGHLVVGQERRVCEVLRGAAGELSDLVEENLPKGKADPRHPTQEGNTGLTSGPIPAAKSTGEQKEADLDEYTEDSEEEVEVEEAEVPPEGAPAKEEATGAEGASREPAGPAPDRTGEGADGEDVDPRTLELRPVPKTSARVSRQETPEDHSRARSERRGEERSPRRPRSPEGRATGSRPGYDEEDSEGRPPLARRPAVKRKRSRDRGTKGARHRERARQFTQKKIQERRSRKAQKECHPKAKRKPKRWVGPGQWR